MTAGSSAGPDAITNVHAATTIRKSAVASFMTKTFLGTPKCLQSRHARRDSSLQTTTSQRSPATEFHLTTRSADANIPGPTFWRTGDPREVHRARWFTFGFRSVHA